MKTKPIKVKICGREITFTPLVIKFGGDTFSTYPKRHQRDGEPYVGWHWKAKAANGKIVGGDEERGGFTSHTNAKRAMNAFINSSTPKAPPGMEDTGSGKIEA